jgi:hypothetical protein
MVYSDLILSSRYSYFKHFIFFTKYLFKNTFLLFLLIFPQISSRYIPQHAFADDTLFDKRCFNPFTNNNMLESEEFLGSRIGNNSYGLFIDRGKLVFNFNFPLGFGYNLFNYNRFSIKNSSIVARRTDNALQDTFSINDLCYYSVFPSEFSIIACPILFSYKELFIDDSTTLSISNQRFFLHFGFSFLDVIYYRNYPPQTVIIGKFWGKGKHIDLGASYTMQSGLFSTKYGSLPLTIDFSWS